MAGLTLAQAQALLDAYNDAAIKIASNQETEITTAAGTTRRLKRANLAEVREMISFLEQRVDSLTPVASGGRRRTSYFVPE